MRLKRLKNVTWTFVQINTKTCPQCSDNDHVGDQGVRIGTVQGLARGESRETITALRLKALFWIQTNQSPPKSAGNNGAAIISWSAIPVTLTHITINLLPDGKTRSECEWKRFLRHMTNCVSEVPYNKVCWMRCPWLFIVRDSPREDGQTVGHPGIVTSKDKGSIVARSQRSTRIYSGILSGTLYSAIFINYPIRSRWEEHSAIIIFHPR